MDPIKQKRQKRQKKQKDRNPEAVTQTIPGRFFGAGGPDRPALLIRDGDLVKTYTRRGLEARVREAALGLLTLGIGPGERVSILLENGPEWIITDLAASSMGAVTVPVYTTLGTEEVAFILKDSGATHRINGRERGPGCPYHGKALGAGPGDR
jgi:long-subunit acyl-CoA synthetase (AMP-forming)